jgi:hypothetical protein
MTVLSSLLDKSELNTIIASKSAGEIHDIAFEVSRAMYPNEKSKDSHILETLGHYSTVFDVICQVDSTMGCMTWGLLKFALTVCANFSHSINLSGAMTNLLYL